MIYSFQNMLLSITCPLLISRQEDVLVVIMIIVIVALSNRDLTLWLTIYLLVELARLICCRHAFFSWCSMQLTVGTCEVNWQVLILLAVVGLIAWLNFVSGQYIGKVACVYSCWHDLDFGLDPGQRYTLDVLISRVERELLLTVVRGKPRDLHLAMSQPAACGMIFSLGNKWTSKVTAECGLGQSFTTLIFVLDTECPQLYVSPHGIDNTCDYGDTCTFFFISPVSK